MLQLNLVLLEHITVCYVEWTIPTWPLFMDYQPSWFLNKRTIEVGQVRGPFQT